MVNRPPAIQRIQVLIRPDLEIRADGGTLEVELCGDYPYDAQLEFGAWSGTDAMRYQTLRDFFHGCVLACEAALADIQTQQTFSLDLGEREGVRDGEAPQHASMPGLFGPGGMCLRPVSGGE